MLNVKCQSNREAFDLPDGLEPENEPHSGRANLSPCLMLQAPSSSGHEFATQRLMAVLRWMIDQHGGVRATYDFVGHAAQQQARQSAPGVR
jgi:hypothetical protein